MIYTSARSLRSLGSFAHSQIVDVDDALPCQNSPQSDGEGTLGLIQKEMSAGETHSNMSVNLGHSTPASVSEMSGFRAGYPMSMMYKARFI